MRAGLPGRCQAVTVTVTVTVTVGTRRIALPAGAGLSVAVQIWNLNRDTISKVHKHLGGHVSV
jgi:hypothetical protein